MWYQEEAKVFPRAVKNGKHISTSSSSLGSSSSSYLMNMLLLKHSRCTVETGRRINEVNFNKPKGFRVNFFSGIQILKVLTFDYVYIV